MRSIPHTNAAKGTITLGDLIAHAIGYLNRRRRA